MKITGIQVWGDSVFRGIQYDEKRGRHIISPRNPVAQASRAIGLPVCNHSRMGYTSVQGFAELKEEGGPGLKDQAVLLEYGGNDCDFDWAQVAQAPDKPHQCAVPPAQYRKTLSQMIQWIRKMGGTPVLTTLPPLDAEKYLSWITRRGLDRKAILSFLGDAQEIYRWQEYYSLLNQIAAREEGCLCLPVRECFVSKGPRAVWTCLDGIHPNDLGHQWILEVFLRQWEQAASA